MKTNAMLRLIENCYWVSPGSLLAGEYPRTIDEATAQQKIDSLISAGVRAFIDLTEESDGMRPYAQLINEYKAMITHERFPIRDVSVPTSGNAAAILDAIDGHLRNGKIVYVHCWGGVGRTGVIVG